LAQGGKRARSSTSAMSVAAVLEPQGEAASLPGSPVLGAVTPSMAGPAPVDPDSTLIILDWDDTILPTTFLALRGYRVDGPDPDEALAAELEVYAQQAELLLSSLNSLSSRVLIVTNAEHGWIELTCKKFLPRLEAMVSAMDKTSARSAFEPQGVTNPFDWKKHAFASIVRAQRRHNILSVGDSCHERTAILWAWQSLGDPRAVVKSLKLLERPDLVCLGLQLSLTRELLQRFVKHPGHLDLFVFNHANNPGLPMQPGDIQVLETPNGFAAAPFAQPLPPPQPLGEVHGLAC